MLDFDSEDIDGMDADEGDDEEPAPTRPWKATSSYDIYMVDTPKEGEGDGTMEDGPVSYTHLTLPTICSV